MKITNLSDETIHSVAVTYYDKHLTKIEIDDVRDIAQKMIRNGVKLSEAVDNAVEIFLDNQ